MGFRFRKSISLGKNTRINIGRHGISSVTFGKRGGPHVTAGRNGASVGGSIPGTGISYSQQVGGAARKRSASAANSVVKRNGSGSSGTGSWLLGAIIVLFIAFMLPSCGSSKVAMPDMAGVSAASAQSTLEDAGFTNVVFEDSSGDDVRDANVTWTVSGQDPEAGAQVKVKDRVTLTLEKDYSQIPVLVTAGMSKDAAASALSEHGYASSDYHFESDNGSGLGGADAEWVVVSVGDGERPTITVHDQHADQVQQQLQEAQQSGSGDSAGSSTSGTVHGGAYCNVRGATGTTSAGTTLTCQTASDGRLRWKK